MDVIDALRTRRMVRSFADTPIDAAAAEQLFAEALRAPTAGNARGIAWVVLVGPAETNRYFDATQDAAWRARSPRAAGLQRAPAVGVCVADPAAYISRYAIEDKASSGLGAGPDAWPIPYWIGDAAFSTMAALLLAEEAGLAGSFLGAFRGDVALRAALEIPAGRVIFGAVLLGHADGKDHRSASLDRPGPSRAERLHRGRFGG